LSGVSAHGPQGMIDIEHPSGKITIDLDADFTVEVPIMRRAALVRTARLVMEGNLLVPAGIL
jgi:2-methylaconitate cis-trans-isomerase PrpF